MKSVGLDQSAAHLNILPPIGAGTYGQRSEVGKLDDEQITQVARDFESVLLHKMLDAMKKTIPESGFLETGTSQQVQDIFWFYLAQDMAKQGGMGLWKTIYEQISRSVEPGRGVSALEDER